jgi:hypothetical protein
MGIEPAFSKGEAENYWFRDQAVCVNPLVRPYIEYHPVSPVTSIAVP